MAMVPASYALILCRGRGVHLTGQVSGDQVSRKGKFESSVLILSPSEVKALQI